MLAVYRPNAQRKSRIASVALLQIAHALKLFILVLLHAGLEDDL